MNKYRHLIKKTEKKNDLKVQVNFIRSELKSISPLCIECIFLIINLNILNQNFLSLLYLLFCASHFFSIKYWSMFYKNSTWLHLLRASLKDEEKQNKEIKIFFLCWFTILHKKCDFILYFNLKNTLVQIMTFYWIEEKKNKVIEGNL